MDVINLRYLFYGYSAALLILLGFVFYLVRRGQRLDRELTRLKSMADETEKQGRR